MKGVVTRVGLEVHVRLATGCRLFSPSPIGDVGDPYVLAHPGTMPMLDAAAVALAGRAAVALGAAIAHTSCFDRKHYVYPDLPRGYQITQQREPFARGGILTSADGAVQCRLERMHLEEDAGRTVYRGDDRCVDLGRAGGALLEIVTEPTLGSGADAEAVLRELHAILVAIGVTDGVLADGDLRCDANVSVSAEAAEAAPRVELKNLNSFRFVAQAVDAEAARQSAMLAAGQLPAAETRSWNGSETILLRPKRPSAAYGWLPEPDVPPLRVSEARIAAWRATLPELPADARARLARHLPEAHAAAVVRLPGALALYDAAVDAGNDRAAVVRWLLGWMAAELNRGRLTHRAGCLSAASGVVVDADWLGALCAAASAHTTAQLEQTASAALDGGPPLPERIAALARPASTAEARDLVRTVVGAHAAEASAYRAGKPALFGFFMGAVRHASGGAIDPALVRALLHEVLDDNAPE